MPVSEHDCANKRHSGTKIGRVTGRIDFFANYFLPIFVLGQKLAGGQKFSLQKKGGAGLGLDLVFALGVLLKALE